MSSPGTVLTNKILAAHGARNDLRLWRNERGVYWAGQPVGHTSAGHLILARASRVTTGLCNGAADLVGLMRGGRFLAVEVKAGKDRLSDDQKRWLALVNDFGGLAGVAASVEDVAALLR